MSQQNPKAGLEEAEARDALRLLRFPEGNIGHALAVARTGHPGNPGNGMQDWECEVTAEDPHAGYVITLYARED